MERIEKEKSHAFWKDVYLLGINMDGKKIWLEAASWDCDWYWGFGYIEEYTSNDPSTAKDICHHSHYSGLIGKVEYYDYEKKCFSCTHDHVYHINESPMFKATVLTDEEAWELSELMESFYILEKTAEIFHRGGSHISTSLVDLKNEQMKNIINQEMLPKIFKRVYEILSK